MARVKYGVYDTKKGEEIEMAPRILILAIALLMVVVLVGLAFVVVSAVSG